ncbi:outer membrane protein assembly factor BamD [Cognatilysobacter lacus]|uniref:Outer membrane protein assembly factor BamD n=1 Tax=Cognatilysobacter lacus TaxID=1643323 RepID=A0A5D8Z8I3_9GAMM|nr:outer membrane protein assembly factor BamD [Lysobacter lacus]TZF90866.1 outer membrane protein assembly factor BamD [Lysobacter lacus]
MTQRSAFRPSPAPLVRGVTVAVLAVSLLAGAGCARFKNRNGDALEGQPVETIYQKAHRSMLSGNWSTAEEAFKRLVAQYPYGPYTEQALIETAYAQYKAGQHDDAVSTIDRFIRTYPTHKNIAYLYYLRGLTNSSRDAVFLQRVWHLDPARRDLATPMQAYNDFSIVAERYGNSRYAADARERMAKLRDTFARYEMDTALYYLRRDANVAAIDRAKYVLENYPQSAYQADAIATLASAYKALGNTTLAADARAELQKVDPNHAYLRGNWPDYPGHLRRLNPFGGDASALKH